MDPSKTGSHKEEKPLNLHRMNQFQRFVSRPDASEMRLLVPWQDLSDQAVEPPPPRGRSRKPAGPTRKPEILKPAPIGHFVEVLLRASLSNPRGCGACRKRRSLPRGRNRVRLVNPFRTEIGLGWGGGSGPCFVSEDWLHFVLAWTLVASAQTTSTRTPTAAV